MIGELAINHFANSQDKLTGTSGPRVCHASSSLFASPEGCSLSRSFILMLLLFGAGLAASSTSRAANLHLLLTPILGICGDHLADLFRYCYPQLFLLSRCAHRGCDRNNHRRRGESGYHFFYHGADSCLRITHPSLLDMKLKNSDCVATCGSTARRRRNIARCRCPTQRPPMGFAALNRSTSIWIRRWWACGAALAVACPCRRRFGARTYYYESRAVIDRTGWRGTAQRTFRGPQPRRRIRPSMRPHPPPSDTCYSHPSCVVPVPNWRGQARVLP
jgi:hypothetical protein